MWYVKIFIICSSNLASLQGEELGKIKNPSTLVDLIYQQEYSEIFQENTIIYFGAEWCVACPAQKAILKRLEKQGYRVKYYDVDKHRKLYDYFKGEGVPLTIIFVDAKIKKQFVGITPRIKQEAKECFISEDSSRKP